MLKRGGRARDSIVLCPERNWQCATRTRHSTPHFPSESVTHATTSAQRTKTESATSHSYTCISRLQRSPLIASHRVSSHRIASLHVNSQAAGSHRMEVERCVARADGERAARSSAAGREREEKRRGGAVLGDWASRSRQRGATGQSGSGSRLDSTRLGRDALHTVRTSRCRRRVAARAYAAFGERFGAIMTRMCVLTRCTAVCSHCH